MSKAVSDKKPDEDLNELLRQQFYEQKKQRGADSTIHAASTALVTEAPKYELTAPALPPVGRGAYTHLAMIELMVTRPDYSHAMLCAHFGRPSSFMATVLASDSFQLALEPFREKIADPSLAASLQERLKSLVIRSSGMLMEKLENEKVTDFTVLKAAEIAIKGLGMGTRFTELPAPGDKEPEAPTKSLAERLLDAMDERDKKRTVDADTVDVSDATDV